MYIPPETQVAKIQIGNPKQSTTFVALLAENSKLSSAELYMVMELPLFNPAAIPDCERITNAVSSALRRSFRGEVTDLTFENALAHINEELGKLAGIGQSNWVGKLSALVAVKADDSLYVATTGKIVAMMKRDIELINLADSPKRSHPLKTFENFATGKIKIGDLFLFSTTNLFNHISIEKFKAESKGDNVTELAKKLTTTLEATAGPDISFGTLLVFQVEPGTPLIEPTVAAPKIESRIGSIESPLQRSRNAFSLTFSKLKSNPFSTLIQKFPFRKKGEEERNTLFSSSGKVGSRLFDLSGRAKEFVSSAKVKYSSTQKKFFLISALVLLVALVINITLTKRFNQKKAEVTTTQNQLQDLENVLNDAEASLVYNDRARTLTLLQNFETKAQSVTKGTNDTKLSELKTREVTLKGKLDKQSTITVAGLGNFGPSTTLIKLPDTLGAQTPSGITSFSKVDSKFTEGSLKCPETITSSIFWKEQKVFVYNSQTLLVCDLVAGVTSSTYAGLVPAEHEFGGLTYYPTSNKLYSINKATGQIIAYEMNSEGPYKAKVWASDERLQGQTSITVDGELYTYGKSGIQKYLSGSDSGFPTVDLLTPLSGTGVIFTQKDFTNIYILDQGNNRIVVIDKKGNLVATYTSEEFTELIDFVVDEKNKTFYILSGGKLLKANW